MPSFTYMDTFREGQWRALRRFVLDERRDAGSREAAIAAELDRIGKIRLLYATDSETGVVSQTRFGIAVEGNPNASLVKLMQAYVSFGGNPLDISLFLYSNDAECPGGGFAYPTGYTYSMQGAETDSDSNIDKYKPSVVGGTIETGSELLTTNMQLIRSWVTKEMYYKRILIEERIIKLSDLYEQLQQELIDLTRAVRGEGMKEPYTTDEYRESHSIPSLVFLFDKTWRVAEEDGRVPEDAEPNTAALGSFPFLIDDGDGDTNNAL